MMSYDMKDTYSISEEGIKVTLDFLEKNDNIIKIIDVQDSEEYRKKDIDLIALFKNNKKATIEVKYDTYKSGNLYFETISNMSKGTEGCLMYSEAHFLFYCFEKYKQIYILNLPKFREWFIKNKENFDRKTTSTKIGNKTVYQSEGYTIPLKAIKKEFKYYKIVDF